VKRHLPWIVATALFMEQLDSTIVNTAVPTIAASLQVGALGLKGVVTSYILSLAIFIPVSGWMADRFGTRRVFGSAVALFTLASMLCGVSINVTMLVASRILQGMAAAMMMPVGRIMIVRSFAKSDLLVAMNFVIVPALIGPLLGPTVGGVIVHWLSWRAIFFVNVPVGLAALWFIHRHLPDYRSAQPRPFDAVGLLLFATGSTLFSWVIGVFGDSPFGAATPVILLLAAGLLIAYFVHARRVPHPLLSLALFRVRTFRIAVLGGFITRLGLGAMPFLLPLLYQLGLGLPAWESGLLLIPMAAAAMVMKVLAPSLLARCGFRTVLTVNTLLIGVTIALFSQVTADTPLWLVVALGAAQGLFNSLQFSSMNSIAYADIEAAQSSMAATIASTLQQMSMSFGLAFGTWLTASYLGADTADHQAGIRNALHATFLTLGALTLMSSMSFRALRPDDGEAVSRGSRHKP
jgi:EmrB/QacA subfamily drug resistance transporter